MLKDKLMHHKNIVHPCIWHIDIKSVTKLFNKKDLHIFTGRNAYYEPCNVL